MASNVAPRIRRSIAKPKIICDQCKLEVGNEDDDIQCDKCSKTYHAICTTLDKRQYGYLLENEEEEYVCHVCNESAGSVSKELKEIKAKQNQITTKLNKLDQLDVLQETMQFMSSQFDDILKTVAENRKKLECLQKENKNLKTEITELKTFVKILNDHRVKNDCIIHGVEDEGDSNAVETVVNIMKEVGVVLHPNEIDDAYFLKKKDESKKKSVVVKFVSRKSKQTVMSSKLNLKSNDDTKEVFVNDYLSKETLALLNYAKSLKEVGYRRVYPMAGKIFTKKSELSRPKLLKNAEEVDSLLLESTRRRRSLRRGHAVLDTPNHNEDEDDDLYESPA